MRKWFLYNSFPLLAPDQTGGGGGNPDPQEDPPVDPDAEFDEMWNEEDPSGDPPPQNNQQQTSQNQPDYNAQLAEHIAKRIPQFEMDEEAAEAFQRGDFKGFQAAMQKQQAGIYQNLLADVGKMMNSMRDKIIKDAVNQSGTQINAQQAVAQMHRDLPWTAKPAVAPVAKAALGQMIKRGKSVTEAIEALPRYFQNMSASAAGGSQNKGRGFNRGNSPNGNSASNDGEDDFLDVLGERN